MKNQAFFHLRIFTGILFFTLLLFGSCVSKKLNPNEFSADIIIYGGTSAAITAAVEAVRSGKSVLVVSPDTHLG
jgi:hypothetical protein